MKKTKHEKKRKKLVRNASEEPGQIGHLTSCGGLHSVVGEIHVVWTCIPFAWLQLLLQALIVGFGEGCKLLVLG